jgi:DNA-binding transcriptional LysR family regulator
VREIAPLYFVVCASPAYLAVRGTPHRSADLAAHNCLRMRSRASGQALNWSLGPQNTPVAPPVDGNLVCNDMTALVTAALHGHGLACAPVPLVLPLLRAGALVPVMPDGLSCAAHVFIHYPNRKNLPARVRTFVNFLLEHLRSNPDLGGDVRTLIGA